MTTRPSRRRDAAATLADIQLVQAHWAARCLLEQARQAWDADQAELATEQARREQPE